MTRSNFLSQDWLVIKERLLSQRTELVERLIRCDDCETRGKIKMIDDVLSWESEQPILVEVINY